jgi:thiol:disulfide interchange protein
MLQRFFLLTFLIFCTPWVEAQELVRNGHVQAQLVSENQTIQPGTPFWVAVRLEMDPEWHVYWENPGDSGTPVIVQWQLPEGFKAGDLQWPFPHKIINPPLTSYGYEKELLLLVPIEPAQDLPSQETVLKAKVDWLVCKISCVPGSVEVSLTLPVAAHAPQTNVQWSQEFAKTRAQIPLKHSEWTIRAANADNSLILTMIHPAKYPLSDVYFFPLKDNLIDHAQEQILKEISQGYKLTIPRSSLSPGPISAVEGILVSKEGWRGPQTEQALMVHSKTTSPVPSLPIAEKQINLTLALLFAFIGGLILNLMPCVLPVLSLKILSLVKHAGDDQNKLWVQGLVFTAGVVSSFLALAGLLIALRLAGGQIGWGFQFQSQPFLIFLSVLFFTLALNLLGVYEITLPFQLQIKKKSGLISTFFNGVLATITATPCTAPFMGTALGFGLSQPPIISLLIFAFLGLGMAFPFLLLTLFPSLLGFLPKPGPWMVHFKRFLGVLLLGTVFWLVWVLGTQMGLIKDSPAALSSSKIAWQSYSSELVQNLRLQGKIVFIDFTAKWCLSCQVNERVALYNAKVIEKIKELDVAMVKADWTNQDPAITQALASYGKNSIPLYVLYGKHSDRPLILPEIITPTIVLDALDKTVTKGDES